MSLSTFNSTDQALDAQIPRRLGRYFISGINIALTVQTIGSNIEILEQDIVLTAVVT